MTLRDYYGEPLAAYSAIAAEHSTMTTWGKEGEKDAVRWGNAILIPAPYTHNFGRKLIFLHTYSATVSSKRKGHPRVLGL